MRKAMRRLPAFALALPLLLGGCIAYDVVDATVSAAGTAVDVTATAVGTTVDAAAAVVPGGDDD